ncbi:MAG: winged helix-turn-helix domain-containing protein [Methylococcales bacterium]|nr:winged helix-turn-helix domain-containing protein [Methylococcales bacterium]
MEQNQRIVYLFGAFRLDMGTQVLWRDEVKVTVSPKVYQLLVYFLQHPERLLSHEELFGQLWVGRIVDDSALRLTVNYLRQALGDNSKAPRYILTVCKRGYRFLATVTLQAPYKVAVVESADLPLELPLARPFPARRVNTQELVSLEQAFIASANGERRLVFLQGEERTGNETLLNQFLEKVQLSEVTVLPAHCSPTGTAPQPFLPLLEIMEFYCREPTGQLLIDRLNQVAPSWLYQLVTVLSEDELARLQPKVANVTTGRMLLEGVNFFESLSKHFVFILILENAHWCDEATLDLVGMLMFREFPARLLVIISHRIDQEGVGAWRIAKMQAEFADQGLCQVLSVQNRRS